MYLYPYVTSPQKIADLFSVIRTQDIPLKFTYRYLANLGFASSKERELVPLLKQLGLIDAAARTTEKYALIKDTSGLHSYLHEKLTQTYKDLFEIDTNVQNVSKDVLVGYFGRLAGFSSTKCAVFADTFIELCRFSKFSYTHVKPTETSVIPTKKVAPNISLNLELPSTTDEKVYESLFKHLKDLLNPQ